jgi:hypothetical protein
MHVRVVQLGCHRLRLVGLVWIVGLAADFNPWNRAGFILFIRSTALEGSATVMV